MSRLAEPFYVHGYRYWTYVECARRHQCCWTTVKNYVTTGRNDQLPPRYIPGRSSYLDQFYLASEQKRLERLEKERERYRRQNRKRTLNL